jgi:DNA-binding response OmpR family regulator
MNSPICRVLCVDDSDDTSLMLTTLLESEGYEVESAGGVADAKRAAEGGRYDLFIVDNRFMDGTGVDLCLWLRGVAPQTPVLFYTGAAQEGDREKGLCAGAAGYVVKPEIGGLIEAVNGLLRGQGCVAAG